MAENKKKNQIIVPGMMRSLNKQMQDKGIQLPEEQSVHETVVHERDSGEHSEKISFAKRVENYTGVKEQGQAIWVPTQVKRTLEMIRIKSSKNIPLRSLAAAMIMAFISEHPEEIENL